LGVSAAKVRKSEGSTKGKHVFLFISERPSSPSSSSSYRFAIVNQRDQLQQPLPINLKFLKHSIAILESAYFICEMLVAL
jgi:hypothetical protein